MFKKVCLALILISILAISAKSLFIHSSNTHTYTIALTVLPDRLEPWSNPVNVYGLILEALYYPLVNVDPLTKNITSAFLDTVKTRGTTSDLSNYVLCLKEKLTFSDGSPVTPDDFLYSMLRFHKAEILAQNTAELKARGSCIEVHLKASDPLYLERFNSISSTILKRSTENEPVPTGVGSYVVQSFLKSKIVLVSSQHASPYFSTIEYIKVVDAEDAISKGITDLNHLYQGPLPASFLFGKSVIERLSMKTYAVLNRISNEMVRKQFASCFPRDEFSKITGLSLKDIPGFLPMGAPGFESKFSDATTNISLINCHFDSSNKTTVDFISYNPSTDGKIREFFNVHRGQLPINVNVVSTTVLEFSKRLMDLKPMIALVGIDSSGSSAGAFGESAVFFESFIRSDHSAIIGERIPDLEAKVRLAVAETSSEKKDQLYRDAQQLVLRSGFCIPLGQLVSTHVYPKTIKNVVWSDVGGELPRIDQLRGEP